jgi:hypothetical protein
VHALIRLKADIRLSDLVRALKAGSSKWLHERPHPIPEFAWQTGYAAFSVSQSKEAAVRSYILRQEAHHKKTRYEDELIGLLKKTGYGRTEPPPAGRNLSSLGCQPQGTGQPPPSRSPGGPTHRPETRPAMTCRPCGAWGFWGPTTWAAFTWSFVPRPQGGICSAWVSTPGRSRRKIHQPRRAGRLAEGRSAAVYAGPPGLGIFEASPTWG